MTPRRILYVCPVGERGGAEVLLRNLLLAHDRRRFEPLVVFLRPGPFAAELEAAGLATHVVQTGRYRQVGKTAKAIGALARLIRGQRVDMVASSLALAHLYGGPAAMVTRRPAVWFNYGLPEGRLPVDGVACRVPARGIFTCSRVTQDALRALLPRSQRWKVRHFPMGVDLRRLDPSRECGKIREELGIPDGIRVVGLVSRFQRWKGHDYFLRAAGLVRRERKDFAVVIVGDTQFGLEPEYARELRDLVHEVGLDDVVHFVGFQDDVTGHLAAMDIVVHGYISKQPGGLGILDAMAMAKPLVATDSGDRLEWMVPGETGLLVRGRDAQAMADGILTLLDDPKRCDEMGGAARRRVEERFTVDTMVRSLERDYGELLDGGDAMRRRTGLE